MALCGCYPQVSPEEAKGIDADLIGGSGDRRGFLDLLEGLMQTREKTVALDDPFHRRTFEPLPAGGLEGRTRAMLKVEDGCANFCTYCIIPYARGRVRSLPLDQAAAEAKRLAGAGYRELVLTGIELSTYGRDLPGKPPLADLIEEVCRAAPGCGCGWGPWSPERSPRTSAPGWRSCPTCAPHFHLSMQSGCDAVLARMGRKYTTARYLESVERLRRYFDRPAITTDMIVGFPGETEGGVPADPGLHPDLRLFPDAHLPYSRRRGTPAADMPGQIPNAVKAQRAHRGAEIAGAMEKSWLTSWIGQTVSVLFEEEKEGFWRGHTPSISRSGPRGRTCTTSSPPSPSPPPERAWPTAPSRRKRHEQSGSALY